MLAINGDGLPGSGGHFGRCNGNGGDATLMSLVLLSR